MELDASSGKLTERGKRFSDAYELAVAAAGRMRSTSGANAAVGQQFRRTLSKHLHRFDAELSSLIRSIVALHTLINNKLTNKRGEAAEDEVMNLMAGKPKPPPVDAGIIRTASTLRPSTLATSSRFI